MRSRAMLVLTMAMAIAFAGQTFAGDLLAASNKKPQQAQQRTLETGVITEATTAELAGAQLYNVVFDESVKDSKGEAIALAKSGGFKPTHVYRNLFKGFAGKMTAEQAAKLARNPKVSSVELARRFELVGQEIPYGITRIDTPFNTVAKIDGQDERVDADVMVIDELVGTNDDLNVVSRADCVDGIIDGTETGNGHGTHVSGTIAALDNGFGVVGVAPGARIWSVNVFKDGGAYDSWIACALDAAITAKVDVANMSLGGSTTRESVCGSTDVMHNAVCRAVSAGVTVVVAAGNSAKDSKTIVPAQYDEVITVSALDDRDGTSSGDRLASFSNFGADVDIAAPGVYVKSTMPNNTYGTMSGTSMASPHVAGAAALYRAENPNATPAQVRQAIIDNRQQMALPYDPDGINEGVLNVRYLNTGNATPTPIPTPSPTASPIPSPTASPTASPIPSPTASPVPSPTASPIPSPTASPMPSPTPAPDTTNPVVTLTVPAIKINKPFTLTATATDASGIDRVEFWSCTAAGGCRKLNSDTNAPYSSTTKLAAGTYELYAVAYDKAGNKGESVHTTITPTRMAAGNATGAKATAGKDKASKDPIHKSGKHEKHRKHGKK